VYSEGWVGFLEERFKKSLSFERLNVSKGNTPQLSQNVELRLRRKLPEEFTLWENIQRLN
jgi:hypothetical protein